MNGTVLRNRKNARIQRVLDNVSHVIYGAALVASFVNDTRPRRLVGRIRMLARILAPRVEAAYVLLRSASGLMFAFHGFQKIFGVLADSQPPVGSQIWIGGLIELVTGVAIALGAYTRWAAFLASGTMAVAYVQFHWKLAVDAQFFPAVNRGELALLYSVVFLYIACRGGGAWGFDRRSAT